MSERERERDRVRERKGREKERERGGVKGIFRTHGMFTDCLFSLYMQ